MKKHLTIIFALLLILSMFSVMGIAFMDHSAHSQCPLGMVAGEGCSAVEDTTASALHHIMGLQSFSESILAIGTGALLLLLLGSVFLVIFFRRPDPPLARSGSILKQTDQLPVRRRLLKWLALHNKRGTLLSI